MSALQTIQRLVTDPDNFFEERADDPGYLGPGLVVLLVAIASVPNVAIQYQNTFAAFDFEGAAASAMLFGQVIAFATSLIGPFVMWLVYALGFYLVSAVFDASGSYWKVVALSGWGFLPLAVDNLVNGAITFYRFEVVGVDLPSEVTSAEQAQQLSQELASGPLVALSSLVSIAFVLLSAYYWTFAIEHARRLDRKQAAIAVLITAVVLGVLLPLRTVLDAL